MVDILHRVGIKSSVAEVYEALTTRAGLVDQQHTRGRYGKRRGLRCHP